MIDRTVGAPGHGKYVVDGLNAVDKRFLSNAMFCILFPEETKNSKSMQFHTATVTESFSFAEECRKLLQNHADNMSSVITENSGKRERLKNTKQKHNVQKKKMFHIMM